MNIEKVTVLGSGCWGTALGFALASAGKQVVLWGREEAVVEEINSSSTNSFFLPGIQIPDGLRATTDLQAAVGKAELILFVLPSKATRSVVEALAELSLREQVIFLSCSKGIESGTGMRMSQIVEEKFPGSAIAALSGPNHAEEVAGRLPSAAVVASGDEKVAAALQQAFSLPWFRIYTSDDIAGVEIGGAVKNVYAIAAGICEGLGLGDNAKAALVTRGLAEMSRLGRAMGAKLETFQGLSGIGDLIVTCYSQHSRNGTVGRRLGKGETLEAILASMPTVAEGVPNTRSIREVAQQKKTETPLIEEVYSILYNGKNTKEALTDLLSRRKKSELER
ncbi:MAG: NAD(P)H-dependent glycerol-3-phosphate dehydrogenase [Verrucomicrobiota bacterium]